MKYTPGLLAGQLSGKAGNTVASRNRNGSYFRTRTIPKLVRNAATTAVRANFTDLSQSFRELSSDQINGWNSLGDQMVRRNSIGQSFRLTGLQAYKSLNQRNLFLANPIISDAPQFSPAPDANAVTLAVTRDFPVISTTVTTGANSATQVVGSTTGVLPGDVFTDTTAVVQANVVSVIDATHVLLDAAILTVTADSLDFVRPSNITVSFDPSPLPADTFLMIFATGPLSGGVSRPAKSAYRFIDVLTSGQTDPATISLHYHDKFGQAPAGTRVFFKAVYVTLTGFAGTPFESEAAYF